LSIEKALVGSGQGFSGRSAVAEAIAPDLRHSAFGGACHRSLLLLCSAILVTVFGGGCTIEMSYTRLGT